MQNRGFNSIWSGRNAASLIYLGDEGKEVALHDIMMVAKNPGEEKGAEPSSGIDIHKYGVEYEIMMLSKN